MVQLEHEMWLSDDEKSVASIEMGAVVRQTADNFPDPRYRPHIAYATSHYTFAGINPAPYEIWPTADGIGTKPELAERLLTATHDASSVETLAYDTLAMIKGDEDRFGRFLVGVAEIVDWNSAENDSVVRALAQGLKAAADAGHFAILNGETAELGYRTSGYGDTRLNWNAVGISLVVPDKRILGNDLAPGQPIVAFREKSIRSNGLSKARKILETAYLLSTGYKSKMEYVGHWFKTHGIKGNAEKFFSALDFFMGHNFLEQVLPPWHEMYPDITRQLLSPSSLYGSVMYKAQGGIDGPRNVDLIAAAHISGGGVPEKTKRMLESKGLGAQIDAVFPDPEGVQSLLKLVDGFPPEIQEGLKINDMKACLQWNRGIGFLVVTRNTKEAEKLVVISERQGYEAAIAGEIIEQPKIIFRGHTFHYKPKID
jgi:phosphoribosylaminoimidazole (AIR) synthetase